MAKRDKKLTYWDILRLYHNALYKSKLYWLSGLLILVGFVLIVIFATNDASLIGLVIFVIGVISLFVSKWMLLGKTVSIRSR